jgi:zinc transport system substrate-binding protein
MLKTQARTVAEALIEADPDNADAYRANLAALVKRIDAAHQRVAEQLAPHAGETLFVYHPAFGYFAEAYGLHQEAVEIEGKEPSPRELQRLVGEAKSDGVRVVFVQPQFDQRSARVVADAIGGTVKPLDPLAHDVIANVETMAVTVAEAFSAQ